MTGSTSGCTILGCWQISVAKSSKFPAGGRSIGRQLPRIASFLQKMCARLPLTNSRSQSINERPARPQNLRASLPTPSTHREFELKAPQSRRARPSMANSNLARAPKGLLLHTPKWHRQRQLNSSGFISIVQTEE